MVPALGLSDVAERELEMAKEKAKKAERDTADVKKKLERRAAEVATLEQVP